MRLWLGTAFALVSLITAASVYVFVDDSSGRTLQSESADLAVGKTASLADDLGRSDKFHAANVLTMADTTTFKAWALNRHGRPFAPGQNFAGLDALQQRPEAFRVALDGRRYNAMLPDNVTVAAAPIFGSGKVPVSGTVIVRAEPPPALTHAFDELRGDRLRALMIAIVIGVLVGFLASSLIAIRIRRLARSAEQMAAGDFEAPLAPGGGDEIGDLTRSLDTMRRELRKTFDMLATERDRLSAVFDGLTEAVIVAGEDGTVRFTNPAGSRLVHDGRPAPALTPSLRRAAEHGADEIPVLVIDGRLYDVQASRVPAEHAVLVVVRDRTEELKRERAEREFVSNAAHELRNPWPVSERDRGAARGAKDDPVARDRFLARLGDDAERMTRLTQSLLILARVEAVGERTAPGGGRRVARGRGGDRGGRDARGGRGRERGRARPVAEGDPVVLRQVLIGLLSNACKNTAAPGAVTLRASAGRGHRDDRGRGHRKGHPER